MRWTQFRNGWLAAVVAAPALAQQPAAARRVLPVPDSVVRELIVPRLRPGETVLPSQSFSGPFGPGARAIMSVTTAQLEGEAHADFRGIVLADSEGAWRVLRLPSLSGADAWAADFLAVMFQNVDDDADLEIIMLADYSTGIGPEGAREFPHVAVFDWDGGSYEHRPDIERRLVAETGAAVRARLRSWQRFAPGTLGAGLRVRARLVYLGQHRPLSAARGRELALWARRQPDGPVMGAIESEYQFREGSTDYWIAVGGMLASVVDRRARPGQPVDAYVTRAGAGYVLNELDTGRP